jgi:hypothetical protein
MEHVMYIMKIGLYIYIASSIVYNIYLSGVFLALLIEVLRGFFQYLFAEIFRECITLITTLSFHSLSYSLFTNHPTIRR